MSNIALVNGESVIEEFSFTWNGGFSYLTYLKKKTKVSVTDVSLIIETQKFYLGIIPSSPSTVEVPLDKLGGVNTSVKIEWFDLIFALGFTWAFFSGVLFAGLLAVLFYWCSFNTKINLINKLGYKISIPTHSKRGAQKFVEEVIHIVK